MLAQQTIQINRTLDDQQIKAVLETVFINKPIKILKALARTGKYAQSTSWVYVENEITGCKMASFISFKDILASFFCWLETIEIMAISLLNRIAIGEVIFACLSEGDRIFSRKHGWCNIIATERTEKLDLPRFWVELDDSIEIIEPWAVHL